MFVGVKEFTSALQADSAEFMKKVQALAVGIARDYEPAHLYLIRIDNWFGPKWMHFVGKISVGKHFYAGIHKVRLHVPPFVPHRVVAERVFAAPDYDETVARQPLHIECASMMAFTRRITDVDKEAAFVWFSGQSEVQKRGSIMVYLPIASTPTTSHRRERRGTGAFYVGLSEHEMDWEPAMLRGVSRGEVEHLEECGRALTGSQLSAATQ
ncbi:MAG TPA: hypothetical protein VFB43_08750 [Terracidiphilus sp.]|nr:hypothetical protein [Terracidiphilus sp.]